MVQRIGPEGPHTRPTIRFLGNQQHSWIWRNKIHPASWRRRRIPSYRRRTTTVSQCRHTPTGWLQIHAATSLRPTQHMEPPPSPCTPPQTEQQQPSPPSSKQRRTTPQSRPRKRKHVTMASPTDATITSFLKSLLSYQPIHRPNQRLPKTSTPVVTRKHPSSCSSLDVDRSAPILHNPFEVTHETANPTPPDLSMQLDHTSRPPPPPAPPPNPTVPCPQRCR